MPVVNCVRERYVLLIPTVIPSLVPSDEQQGRSARIEGVKHAVRAAFVLDTQLAHMRVTRHLDARRMGHPESWAHFLKQADGEIHAFLLGGGKLVPPFTEFVG